MRIAVRRDFVIQVCDYARGQHKVKKQTNAFKNQNKETPGK